MPTEPNVPLIERPKCYTSECGRTLDGKCARVPCPLAPARHFLDDMPKVEEVAGGWPLVNPADAPPPAEPLAKIGAVIDGAAERPDPPFPVDPRDEHHKHGSILQSWVTGMGRRHQGVILAGVRGCDTAPKNDPSKLLARVYRAYTLVPFVLVAERAATFITPATGEALARVFREFRKNLDHYPHHYVMHVVHAAEIVGHYHFDHAARTAWNVFYLDLCRGLHVTPETREELDRRLTADESAFGAEDRR